MADGSRAFNFPPPQTSRLRAGESGPGGRTGTDGGMKPFRANRRPGNRPMTEAQLDRVFTAKETVCIPCLVWAMAGKMPLWRVCRLSEYDHCKSGNIRRGHDEGFASCQWHPRRVIPEGWTGEEMNAVYGPSLLDGSALFHETYGSDDELIEIQNEVLERVRAQRAIQPQVEA